MKLKLQCFDAGGNQENHLKILLFSQRTSFIASTKSGSHSSSLLAVVWLLFFTARNLEFLLRPTGCTIDVRRLLTMWKADCKAWLWKSSYEEGAESLSGIIALQHCLLLLGALFECTPKCCLEVAGCKSLQAPSECTVPKWDEMSCVRKVVVCLPAAAIFSDCQMWRYP